MKKLLLLLFINSAVFIVPDVNAIQNMILPDTVKIGFLIQDNNSRAALDGAEMAINKANKEGGVKSKTFKLVVRSMEGPWGTGSKQAVDLIFDEKVTALIGSHDGRNAHLVEQVSAKARVVFLSSWAGDPTLSQAFVPWFFSCVPNDLHQADAFIDEVYNKRKLNKIATISDNGYDAKLATESFVKRAESAGKHIKLQLHYDIQNKDFNDVIVQINKADINGIILFGQPPASLKLIQEFEKRKMNQTVFGSLSLIDEDELPDHNLSYYKNIVLIYPGNLLGSKGLAFRDEYLKKYGTPPGAVAAYSFDAMNILIQAIKKAGLERENIQKTLAKMRYEGVTGLIQFDDKGKRLGTPGFIEIKNGSPVIPIKKSKE